MEPWMYEDSPPGKIVGTRRPPKAGEESLAVGADLNRLVDALRPRPIRVKHGVYRFRSHEEADEWWMKHLIP